MVVARARHGLLLLWRLAQEELLILDDLVRAAPWGQAPPVVQPVWLPTRPGRRRPLRHLGAQGGLRRFFPSKRRVHRCLNSTV